MVIRENIVDWSDIILSLPPKTIKCSKYNLIKMILNIQLESLPYCQTADLTQS